MKKAKKSKTDNESSFRKIKHVAPPPVLFCFLHGLTGERSRKTNIPLRSVMLRSIERPHSFLRLLPFLFRRLPFLFLFFFVFFFAAKLIFLAGAYKVAPRMKKENGKLIKRDRDNARSCRVEKYDDTLG